MHFRERGNIVQIVRVSYDDKTKKAKNEIIGKLRKNQPEITEQLKSACTPEEINQINEWIESKHKLKTLRAEYAARTLATQIDEATYWFKNSESASLHALAADILPKLVILRKTLKERGLL